MNFLSIVQDAVVESGLHDVGPTTVVDATDLMYKRFILYVQREWQDIQLACPSWKWMKKNKSFELSVDKYEYTATELDISLSRWDIGYAKIYLTSEGISGERHLPPSDYETFRRYRLIREVPTGFPGLVAQNGETILFYPSPDANYTASIDYYSGIQSLSLDADEPELPEKFHRLLVDGALARYASFDDAPEIGTGAKERYGSMMFELIGEQQPTTNITCGPIA